MLKKVLYASALSSIITLSAFATEEALEINNPAVESVIIEQEIQEPKLSTSNESEVKEDLVATDTENEVKEDVVATSNESEVKEDLAATNSDEEANNQIALNNEEEETNTLLAMPRDLKDDETNSELALNDEENKENILVTLPKEEASVTASEEIIAPENIIACGCKKKDKKDIPLACGQDNAANEEQKAEIACADCGGKHLFFANNEPQNTEDDVVLKAIVNEELKAA